MRASCWVAAALLLLLAAPARGQATVLVGTIVELSPQRLILHSLEGSRRTVRLAPSTRRVRRSPGEFQRGDLVAVEGGGTPWAASALYEAGTHPLAGQEEELLFGRVRALDIPDRRVTVEGERGIQSVRVTRATVVFKDDRPASWLDIHPGARVAVRYFAGPSPPEARLILDPLTYVVRQLERTSGKLLAWGTVNRVEGGHRRPAGTVEVRSLEGRTLTVRFDRRTRWQLGARFSGPEDFLGVEALLFGHNDPPTAHRIVARPAVLYLFEAMQLSRRNP